MTPDAALGRRADLYRDMQTDALGSYQFQDIAPGDYKLFAWEAIEFGAWQDRDFMRAYNDRGIFVRVSEGSKQTVDAAFIQLSPIKIQVRPVISYFLNCKNRKSPV